MNKRIAWIDVARGIGIILVVYGHVLRGLFNSGIIPSSSVLFSSDYIIYTFHMPLFLLMAGLNVRRSLAKGIGRFLKSKIFTIAYPYLLWSFVQGSIEVALSSHLNNPVSLHDVLSIPWQPIKQFWFFYDLFIFHCIAAFTANRRIVSLLLLAASFAFAFYVGPEQSHLRPITYAFVFYEIGVLLDSQVLAAVDHLKAHTLPILIVLFSLAVHYGGRASGYNTQSVYAVPSALLGIAMTFAVSKLIVDWAPALTRGLTTLGVASTTIYILHVLAAAGTRVILKALGIYSLNVQLVLGMLLGIGVPLMIYFALVRLGILSVVGLGIQPRPAKEGGPKVPPGSSSGGVEAGPLGESRVPA